MGSDRRPWSCRLPLLALIVVPSLLAGAAAQGGEAHEFWPELQFHYWFDERRSRAIFLLSNGRDRDDGTGYQSEAGLTVEHHFTETIWGRIGYRHANATDGGPFIENRLLTEQIFRIPLDWGVSADLRLRQDFRWLDNGFFVRLRERLQVQRDFTIGTYRFTPYASAEVYFDTRYNQMSRYRLIVGVTLPIYDHFSIEPYLVRQVDNAGSFTITNAFGLTLITAF
ncbi:MAG: DUF2490 domain-containing protein [Reyranella sp.]|uniref:DUF2490 domain-containing protein n=1 Tax=Reyranella sp. TaxID=1929291 RepID=UPI003D0F5688